MSVISTGSGAYSADSSKRGGGDDQVDSTLGLGELAQLTVNNEAEPAYDVSLSLFINHFFIYMFGLFNATLCYILLVDV